MNTTKKINEFLKDDFEIPTTQYVKNGDINIAYQIFGEGTTDLVYVPGWVSNIDWMWNCPELVTFFKELSKTARIILFDKRGTGLSDREVDVLSLETQIEDINVVMNIANSKKAILFGHSEGGSAAALFSVIHPEKVISLMTFGVYAKRKKTACYPWGPTDQEREKLYDMIENNWSSGKMLLGKLAPSKVKDQKFKNWLTSYFRTGASPSAAMRLTKMNAEVDIVDILKYIKVPTLLMQRTHDSDVNIEEGRFIAERIEGSKLVEFEGEDHLFWVGNSKEVLNEMKSFIEAKQQTEQPKKGLQTIVFGQFITSLKSGTKLDVVEHLTNQYGATVIQLDHKKIIISFKNTNEAVNCSVSLLKAFEEIHTNLAMGVYVKERDNNQHWTLTEKDIYIQKAILSQSHPNQILVTQTIKHLLAGTSIHLHLKTAILNFGTNNVCKIYSVVLKSSTKELTKETTIYNFTKYDSFLDNVLQIIEDNIENETLNVSMISEKTRISERHLQRKIKETTNISPNQLITRLRLHKSKKVLITTNLTIAEIAFKFGFSSPSYFTKCFKKEFGVNPTIIQNNLKVIRS